MYPHESFLPWSAIATNGKERISLYSKLSIIVSMRFDHANKDRLLVPVHFNTTMTQREAIEEFAELRRVSLGAAMREIVAYGLGSV